MIDHYAKLFPAYMLALLSWVLLEKIYNLSKATTTFQFTQPKLDLGLSLLAVICTLAIGQLYLRVGLLPKVSVGVFLVESINQLIIFSPFLLLLLIRKQPLTAAWIPARKRLVSLFLGFILAQMAIMIFINIGPEGKGYWHTFQTVYHWQNLPHLIQVLLEDVAIAVCYIRFQAVVGKNRAITLVALLFAAAHIPAMLAHDSFQPISGLFLSLDVVLGVVIIMVLTQSKNILWFWMLHFAMDMMQFST